MSKFTDHYSHIVFSTILREGGGAGHGAAVHATLRWLDEHLPYPNTIKDGSMSDVYARTCTTCGHKINDHDANECWNTEAHGEQCHCPWMGASDE